ncbi:MAG: LysR substrate-binding domain-containing protein, partial [Shewanella sp.]
ELVNHPCILLQTLGSKENTWLYLDKETKDMREVSVTGSYVCDQIQPAIELAKQGLGVLYTPLFTVGPEVDSGALQPCFSEDICIESVRYLIYRKREYQPYRVQVVIDAIVNFMALHFARTLIYSQAPDSTFALMQIAKKTIPKC